MPNNAWSKRIHTHAPPPGEILEPSDGGFVLVVFRGSPHEIALVFTNGANQLVTRGALPSGVRIDMRVLANTIDLDKRAPRIVKLTPKLYDDLLLLMEKYPLSDWAFLYSRNGVGKDTRWTIAPFRPLMQNERTAIEEAPLFDLDAFAVREYGAPEMHQGAYTASGPGAPSASAATERVMAIESALAGLPPEAATEVLKAFAVKDLAAIPHDQVRHALAFAEALRAEHEAANPASTKPRRNL